MQLSPVETICMKYQILFSVKNKILNFSSAELAKSGKASAAVKKM